MKYAVIGVRVLLGLGFMVFGANILHPFMPMPMPPEGSLTAQFFTVMMPTHWMLLVGFCQLLGGAFVLSGKLTPAGLVILGPVLVNILSFHIFIQGGEGIGPGLVFTAFEIFLIFAYREYFKPFFCPNAKPAACKT
jgi:putative oxidoreductase